MQEMFSSPLELRENLLMEMQQVSKHSLRSLYFFTLNSVCSLGLLP